MNFHFENVLLSNDIKLSNITTTLSVQSCWTIRMDSFRNEKNKKTSKKGEERKGEIKQKGSKKKGSRLKNLISPKKKLVKVSKRNILTIN